MCVCVGRSMLDGDSDESEKSRRTFSTCFDLDSRCGEFAKDAHSNICALRLVQSARSQWRIPPLSLFYLCAYPSVRGGAFVPPSSLTCCVGCFAFGFGRLSFLTVLMWPNSVLTFYFSIVLPHPNFLLPPIYTRLPLNHTSSGLITIPRLPNPR